MTAPVSVLIITFNEEANLESALRSVIGWSDDIHVVDSFSTDRTPQIAEAFCDQGVHFVQHPFESHPAQLNWALDTRTFRHPWILRLDADERATGPFKEEVDQIVKGNPTENGFFLNRRFFFLGQWLRWGGLYPNGDVRFWRTHAGRFEQREINEHLILEGCAGYLREPLDHEDQKPLARWLERHISYSVKEARAILSGDLSGSTQGRLFGNPVERRVWLRECFYRLPFRSTLYFLYRFVLRAGFLDGRAGFRFAFLHASYLYWISLHIEDAKRNGRTPELAVSTRLKAPHHAR